MTIVSDSIYKQIKKYNWLYNKNIKKIWKLHNYTKSTIYKFIKNECNNLGPSKSTLKAKRQGLGDLVMHKI
jgi:hypothetical protein